MTKLIKIELFKLFSGKKVFFFFGAWIFLISSLIVFLRIVASESSFGSVFKISSDTFSIFATIVGVIIVLVSFHQEMQQKTMKSLLASPVKRLEILFSKLFVSVFISFLILIVLSLTTFLITTVLFGFFTEGAYSSSAENMLDFVAGLIQILTAFMTTIFYSTTILCLFLIANSLSIALIGAIVLRSLGELVSRSLLNHNNLILSYSPLGILNILNPMTTNQTIMGYTGQLLLTIIYSIAICYLCYKLFENKEF
ncbi:ABC transporter permease [Streptococcus zalophi]|uniref:ABC transporter permease n=1 Tax=Streptococcus zalophi TaxID=640031 RepID=A0A934P8T9_9STRE|nr:ABC transporter permease [Streptococcus zalophi]MBJ8349123.1 ABC transporter permease [Streptococcus zalophi]